MWRTVMKTNPPHNIFLFFLYFLSRWVFLLKVFCRNARLSGQFPGRRLTVIYRLHLRNLVSRSMGRWARSRQEASMSAGWCRSSAACWRKWRASARNTRPFRSWWDPTPCDHRVCRGWVSFVYHSAAGFPHSWGADNRLCVCSAAAFIVLVLACLEAFYYVVELRVISVSGWTKLFIFI